MASAKKKKDQLIKMSPPGLPMCKVTIKLDIKAEDKPNWQIDSDLFINNMNIGAACTQEVIMGDRILKINGNAPKSAKEAEAALSPGSGAVKLEVQRRQNAVPATAARMKKIGHAKLEGFGYSLVTCTNTGKHAKATLGFTLSLLKNKAYLMAVEAGSIASQHFAVGDALLDVDGDPIPFTDINFLKNYSHKFFKDGQFTVVVERPTTPQRIDQMTIILKTMTPQSTDMEMGADAIKIGMEASSMHNLVFRKIRPKSCLTADAAVGNTAVTTVCTVDDGDKRVRMSSRSVQTVIGSDVDDEDDLKKVERKSHSKEQMNLDDL